ncbi:MAG: hypothetical protein GDA44_14485 [Prochloron sp. SP5CPC1]|nr:hypothetical protein [Candidatus Paraprochloron terpiosi SP5CPC1]
MPVDVLMQLAKDADVSVREKVLKNPRLSPLQRYQMLLLGTEAEEIEQANNLLARRSHSLTHTRDCFGSCRQS